MDSEFWRRLFDSETLFMIAVMVFIIAGASVAIVRMLIAHNERITMIQHGIIPDKLGKYNEENMESHEE